MDAHCINGWVDGTFNKNLLPCHGESTFCPHEYDIYLPIYLPIHAWYPSWGHGCQQGSSKHSGLGQFSPAGSRFSPSLPCLFAGHSARYFLGVFPSFFLVRFWKIPVWCCCWLSSLVCALHLLKRTSD